MTTESASWRYVGAEPMAVVLRAQPREGGGSYLILLQHEGVRSRSAAVQVGPCSWHVALSHKSIIGP